MSVFRLFFACFDHHFCSPYYLMEIGIFLEKSMISRPIAAFGAEIRKITPEPQAAHRVAGRRVLHFQTAVT
jgi:hypothetical protein